MKVNWPPLSNGSSHLARPGDIPAVGPGETPPADVIETKDALIVEVELPGHDLSDIDVQIAGSQLAVHVERKLVPAPGRTYHRSERPYGRLHRSFVLPTETDADRITATYHQGVLRIELPKREELKPRTIKVSSAE